MATLAFFNVHSLTGTLLVLSFISFAIGATLPIVGKRGNMNIFNLPVREQLMAIAGNAGVWRWANVFMGAAAVILLAGLTMLTTILEGAGERILSRLGLVGWLVVAVLWLVFSAFRAVVTVSAAQEMAERRMRVRLRHPVQVDARVVQAAAAAGYETACLIGRGIRPSHPLAWPRVGLSSLDGWLGFRLKVARPVRNLRATSLVRPLEALARRVRNR